MMRGALLLCLARLLWRAAAKLEHLANAAFLRSLRSAGGNPEARRALIAKVERGIEIGNE
jgi:hypothetical protein